MTRIMQLHHHMMITLMMIILLLAAGVSSEGGVQIAKSNCTDYCGNISIPYPFGIGPDERCYFNRWFQVDCLNGIKPFLNLTNLEVRNISISQGTLQVYSPVTSFCNGNPSSQAPNLTGSPLVYSERYNKFTAVTCGFLTLVRSSDDLFVGGCRSICEEESSTTSDFRANEGCDIGVNCCQTTIPPYLTVIDAFILPEPNNKSADCNDYSFLVDSDWFDNTTFRDVKSMPSVPVVLEWSLIINYTSYAAFQPFLNHSGRFDDPRCVISSPTYTYNRSKISCYCPNGFEGNPYLLQHCDDINECTDDHTNICWRRGYYCMNYPGTYGCYIESGKSRKTKVKLILIGLGMGVGLLLLLIGTWWLHKVVKKRKNIKSKELFYKRNGGLLLEQQLSSGEVNVEKIKLFKSKELEKSTDNFNIDRILGQGGQGTVYKGMLADGRIIAVKKSKIVDEGQLSNFINEVVILSQINHRNVVQLLGCCLETEVPLLVYEFIANGTLSQYIHDQSEEFPLTWKIRLRIATEIAGALSYLHYAASFPIFHRDIKSTNILLDEKYRAKVADFGTSRSVAIDQTHLTTLVHGTFGYLDPEYFQSSQFTEKSDVYSFGVVLVELLTGKKPISFTRTEGRSLATYFIISMQEDRLLDILDSRIVKEGPQKNIMVVANLARRCLNLSGRKRPTMREVTAELEGIQMSEKASNVEVHDNEEVEFVRTESIEPWDVVSSSAGTGSLVLDGGPRSSFHKVPLLSHGEQNIS